MLNDILDIIKKYESDATIQDDKISLRNGDLNITFSDNKYLVVLTVDSKNTTLCNSETFEEVDITLDRVYEKYEK